MFFVFAAVFKIIRQDKKMPKKNPKLDSHI